jgi:hypothetical protein
MLARAMSSRSTTQICAALVSALLARPVAALSSHHWGMTMSVRSHPRWVVSSLAALLVLPFAAGAQSVALSGTRLSSSTTDSRLSAVPVTAPVAIASSVPSTGTASGTPTPRLDVDPIPTSTSAQVDAQGSTETESPTTAESGPTSASATAGIHSASHRLSHQELAAAANNHGGGFGTDGALMIVGGAGFIAGLIIGGGAGTAIAIAGAVIALYGLYLYLR